MMVLPFFSYVRAYAEHDLFFRIKSAACHKISSVMPICKQGKGGVGGITYRKGKL